MGQRRRKAIFHKPVLEYKKTETCAKCEIPEVYDIDDMWLDYENKTRLVVMATCPCGANVKIKDVPEYIIDHLKEIV